MKVTWYGHSCFMLEQDGYKILLDPYYPDKVPGLRLPALAAHEVLCSHQHADHGAAELVERLPGKDSPFAVTEVAVFHDHHGGEHRGANTVRVFEAGGVRLAHMGDLGHPLTDAQVKAIGPLDAVLMPVGGCYTVGPQEAREAANRLMARVVIPMHYRGEGFGYPVIGPVEDFLDLCANVQEYISNSIEITPKTPAQTAVLALPSQSRV